jgi:Ni/Fe-hydrogenase subunit HybB-like protein
MRVRITKTILWALVGAALVALVARFVGGLGVTTNLSDITPWGLWIGLKLAGVAFAAGGFTIAAVVYIFRLQSYHMLARRSVLIGFLGYTFFVVSLIVDLGIPWNIWRPVVFWNLHSPLFEVAWCVMLYLTVLALEFAPVVLEKYHERSRLCDAGYRLLKRVTIPIVIFGIALSVLHQSSLGTLFAIMPHRQHPLFYSPIINVQFFVSCVAMGLAAVIVESHLANFFYRRRINDRQLRHLGRFLAWVVWLFVAVRLGDLALRGDAHFLVKSGWNSVLFWLEMVPLLLVPSLILQWRRIRESRFLLAAMAFTVVIGFILNRLTVAGLATISPTGTSYFPSALEILMSLGLVPGVAVLIWMYLVENYEVWQHEEAIDDVDTRFAPPQLDRASGVWLGDSGLANFKVYSLAFVLTAALTFGLLPRDVLFGASPVPAPVQRARGREVLLIDGDRAGTSVRFDHAKHEEKLGREESCVECHHMANPMDQDTPCSSCHRDMWSTTDIFNHDDHVRVLEGLGARDSCAACHPKGGKPKARETASNCDVEGCHRQELTLYREGARVQLREATRARFAVGYMDAMHALCIECHKERGPDLGRPHHAECATCHQHASGPEATILEHLRRRHGLDFRTRGQLR